MSICRRGGRRISVSEGDGDRQFDGIRHRASPKHLGADLAKICYQSNRRDLEDCWRVDDLLGHVSGELTYKAQTNGETDTDR